MSRRGHFLKSSRQTSYLPVDSWPNADQEMWTHIHRRGDVYDTGGRGAHWEQRTVRNVSQGYGTWLKWLSEVEPEAMLEEPLARATRSRLAQYTKALEDRSLAPSTIQIHIQRLGQMMAAAAGTNEFGWIFVGANRLKPASVRNKQARIVPSYHLAELGFQLMRQAESLRPPFSPAARFRLGLQIAFMAYRPVRLGNMTQMVLGKHLIRNDTGDYHTCFREDETKTGIEIAFDVPRSLTHAFDTYLALYRPQLFSGFAEMTSVWVSRDGGPMTSSAISDQFIKATRKKFGFHINPHMFRDCAATTIAQDDPEHASAIAKILGHSTMATSEKHYNQARMIDAAHAVHAAFEPYRKSGARA